MSILPSASLFSMPKLLRPSEDVSVLLTPAQQKQRDEADNVISRMKNIQESMVSDRKGQAREKLDRAKEKLRMLRLMGMDPKQVARQAAQIAREIKAAAAEYASATRDGATISGVTVDASATSASASVSGGTAAANGNEPKEINEQAEVKASEAQASSAGAETAKSDNVGRVEDAKFASPEEVKKAYQDAAKSIEVKGNLARAEREVLREFKDAATEAKRLIDEAARKLKAKKPGDNDAREAEQAGRQMNDAVTDLGKAISDYLNPPATVSADGAVAVSATNAGAVTVSLLI